MESALIAGGSGFFGEALARALIERGVKTAVFDLEDYDERPEEVRFIRGDVRDRESIMEACSGFDVVFNSVALVPLAKNAREFWRVNRDGAENLLGACAKHKVKKVVHLSSSAVFGVPAKNPVDDDTAPAPAEEYGRSKLAAEDLCRRYVGDGLDVTIIRPRTIMGPGRLGIMQIIFEWTREGRNLPVLGRGDNLYQFVHASDLADACVKAAARDGASVYNVGGADFCSMRETLEGLAAHARTGSRVVSLPMTPAIAAMALTGRLGLSPLGSYHWIMYGRSMYFDISKVKQELDWSPRFGNVEMFCDSYDWYVNNRESVLARTHGSAHRRAARQGILKLVSAGLGLLGG